MSINKLELLNTLEKIAALGTAESWDNCGMQIDLQANGINKILVCLEITTENLAEAILLGADFIITHHPLYFSGIQLIDRNDIIGKYTCDLITHGISVYSSHTCFDSAALGNNADLARLLGLKHVKDFRDLGFEYMGLYGQLETTVTLKSFISHMEKVLQLKSGEIKVVGRLDQEIKQVGLCTGAGSSMIDIAKRCGCQLFITGDVKYHDAIKAREMGLNLLDGGHYGTEKIFVSNMAEQLRKAVGDKVQVLESQIDINPFLNYGTIS